MPWKKDLAKLKQELGKEEPPSGKALPPPKAKPVHPVSSSIEEEDNIFLSAMGLRPRNAPRPSAPPVDSAPPPAMKPVPPPPTSRVEFSAAMGDLKGLKPILPAGVQGAAAPKPEVVTPAPSVTAPPVPAPPAPEPEALAPLAMPLATEASGSAPQNELTIQQVQIHLAAGMAIVVDGSLDLKGHARSDAEERLKERILDGYALGWRTLHVVVGPSDELRQMVLDLLRSPAGGCVVRFAQAPVPMGGPQAWILYFRSQGSVEN
jgi:DNA-nicking Smr family endonuclease